MDANDIWARLDATLRERGLAGLIQYADPADIDELSVADERDPDEDTVRALLPESYRRFVATYRCPAVEPSGLRKGEDEGDEGSEEDEEFDVYAIDDAVRFFEFLPYHRMRWATGTMGHPGRQWVDVRAERERGEYRWEYVMFAAFDAADGCGWAFWPAGDEAGAAGEPQVWYVEDSLPEEQVGTFAEWLDAMVADMLNGLAGLGLVDAPALE